MQVKRRRRRRTRGRRVHKAVVEDGEGPGGGRCLGGRPGRS